MVEDGKNTDSNVSNSDKPISKENMCFNPGDVTDEINAFLAMDCFFDFEESDPLHHEFAGELITIPPRVDREHKEYLNLMRLLCDISSSRPPKNFHANPSSIIESLPTFHIPVEDSDSLREEINIFLVPEDLIPSSIESDLESEGDVIVHNDLFNDDLNQSLSFLPIVLADMPCTDIANITRKQSKPGKNEYKTERVYKSREFLAKRARRHHVLSLARIDKRNDTLASYKHTREEKFALKPLDPMIGIKGRDEIKAWRSMLRDLEASLSAINSKLPHTQEGG
ncbi:hypothetical protein Tco_0047384 [Tanacetum coccineum]